ncbi:GntR family transcriptional regulator [Gracilibacillus sp. HCP3S3_G5_1]|uniref:GntR family transcriptional regulator n=1 Tax=unclassified Gracilibacillus TaxID=2625209 RepID=UPI003F8BD33C
MGNNSLIEEAYKKIRTKILTCELPPGTLLSIYKLAEDLEMSRTPISNAIGRLEREGLVIPLKNRGVLVKEYTPRELIEIFEINYAYQLFVLHLVENKENYKFDIAAMEEIVSKQQDAKEENNYITYVQLSLSFFRTFIETIDNETILSITDANIDKIMINAVVKYNHYPQKRIYSGLSFNTELLHAVKVKDYKLARILVDNYYSKTRERIILKI